MVGGMVLFVIGAVLLVFGGNGHMDGSDDDRVLSLNAVAGLILILVGLVLIGGSTGVSGGAL